MKTEKTMRIELTRDDFRELLLLASLGDLIRGRVMDIETGEQATESHDIHDRVIDALYEVALDEELPEVKRHEDHIDPSPWFDSELTRIFDEYEDDVLWYELAQRLGKRDFERTRKHNARARIDECVEKYAHELEANGLDRIEINDKAPQRKKQEHRISR